MSKKLLMSPSITHIDLLKVFLTKRSAVCCDVEVLKPVDSGTKEGSNTSLRIRNRAVCTRRSGKSAMPRGHVPPFGLGISTLRVWPHS